MQVIQPVLWIIKLAYIKGLFFVAFAEFTNHIWIHILILFLFYMAYHALIWNNYWFDPLVGFVHATGHVLSAWHVLFLFFSDLELYAAGS